MFSLSEKIKDQLNQLWYPKWPIFRAGKHQHFKDEGEKKSYEKILIDHSVKQMVELIIYLVAETCISKCSASEGYL